jgi:hypothetical protein
MQAELLTLGPVCLCRPMRMAAFASSLRQRPLLCCTAAVSPRSEAAYLSILSELDQVGGVEAGREGGGGSTRAERDAAELTGWTCVLAAR